MKELLLSLMWKFNKRCFKKNKKENFGSEFCIMWDLYSLKTRVWFCFCLTLLVN